MDLILESNLLRTSLDVQETQFTLLFRFTSYLWKGAKLTMVEDNASSLIEVTDKRFPWPWTFYTRQTWLTFSKFTQYS